MENKNIETEMIELSLFEDIKKKYRIMSVPAIIVNDEKVQGKIKLITGDEIKIGSAIFTVLRADKL